MPSDMEEYYDYLEQKRKEVSEHAFELFIREGTLCDKKLLEESNALNEAVNKALLEERLSHYYENHITKAAKSKTPIS